MKAIQTIEQIELEVQALSESSPAVRELFALAENEVWPFSVLGQAPMPTQPVRLQDWLIIPAEQDTSQIPDRAMERVQAIFEAGIRPKGFVVVHEAPMLLPAPPQEKRKPFEDVDWDQVRVSTGKGLLAATQIAGTIAVGLVGAVFTTLFLGLAALDPILIAVTEDDYWIEIDRWYV